jgi:hypothetical protein
LPLVTALLALTLLVQLPRSRPTRFLARLKERSCEYGSLPGRWVADKAGHRHWRLFDEACQLQDLLGPRIRAGRRAVAATGTCAPTPPDTRLLFLGDSVDRTIIKHTCQAADGLQDSKAAEGGACTQKFLEDEGWACRLPGIVLANQVFWGASPVGPYNLNRSGSPAERLQRALAAFPQAFGGPPDVIVLGVNLWDLARWKMMDREGVMASNELSAARLAEWTANADAIFSLVKGGAAAGAALVFHTLHLPRLDDSKKDGTLAHATISRRAHVAQLNAAGRHLARRHGFQILDLELMTVEFHDADPYLMDNTHPAAWFSREIANVVLNIAAAAQQSSGGLGRLRGPGRAAKAVTGAAQSAAETRTGQ